MTDSTEARMNDIHLERRSHPDQCLRCTHWRGDATCDAFLDLIPIVILRDEHDHRKPYPGDHGIRFEPVKTDDDR